RTAELKIDSNLVLSSRSRLLKRDLRALTANDDGDETWLLSARCAPSRFSSLGSTEPVFCEASKVDFKKEDFLISMILTLLMNVFSESATSVPKRLCLPPSDQPIYRRPVERCCRLFRSFFGNDKLKVLNSYNSGIVHFQIFNYSSL